MPNLIGSTVNAGGTKIATAKVLGTGKLATTDISNDAHTFIVVGNRDFSVKAAIAMGMLNRDSSGTLVELNPASVPTIVKS